MRMKEPNTKMIDPINTPLLSIRPHAPLVTAAHPAATRLFSRPARPAALRSVHQEIHPWPLPHLHRPKCAQSLPRATPVRRPESCRLKCLSKSAALLEI